MVGHCGFTYVVGTVVALASLGHVARIDPVGRDLIGVHIDERHEVLVGHVTVVALQEVVDDVLPVARNLVFESMGKGQTVNIGSPAGDLCAEFVRLLREGSSGRVQIHVDETAELLDLHLVETDSTHIEVGEMACVSGGLELAR